MAVVGTNPVIVIGDDGTETSYALVTGSYVAPTGVYDALVHNGDGSWTLTKKGGVKYNFRASDGMLSTVVDTNGNTTTLAYTGSYLTSITDAASRVLTLGYDVSNRLANITDCQSRVWTLTYDTSSRVKQIAEPLLSGTSYTRLIGYDTNNNINSHTNRLGKQWQYAYASNGRLTGTTDPDTKTTGLAYTTLGIPATWPSSVVNVGTYTDANANGLQHGFDTNGRLLGVQDAASNLTTYTYDTSNNKLSTTLPSTLVWQSTWDGRGNELITQDPLGKQTIRTYGTFDTLSTETDANSHETQYFYDTNGNLTSVIDPNSNTVTNVINGDGTTQQTTDQESRVTKYGYDGWGHQASVTVVKDALTNFVTAFVYDKGSHLTQRTDALSRITNYTLDDWGRTTAAAYPTSGNAGVSFVLDAEGNATQTTDGTGIRNYTYDSWGRRKTMTDPRGSTAANYDSAGNLLTQTDVTGRLLTNVPNAINQLTKVTDGNDSTHADFTYKPDGQKATATYPNGTKVTYGYDNAGRVNSISHNKVSGGTLLVSYAGIYDDGGRLTSITEQAGGDVTSYGYDNADSLTSESRTGLKPYSGTYTYDKTGRRKTAIVVTNGTTTHNGTYTYDGAGRLTQVVDTATSLTEAYAWNNDGSLFSAPGSGYVKQFVYDEESRLTRIQHNVSGTISTAFDYAYGADGGRRWKKDYSASQWTWYPCGVACLAGELVEQTSDLTGTTWTTAALYMRAGGGCSSTLVRRNSEYHHEDILGNFGVTTGATGSAIDSKLFDAFGVLRYSTGSAATQWRQECAYISDDGLLVGSNPTKIYLIGRCQSLLGEQHPFPPGCHYRMPKCRPYRINQCPVCLPWEKPLKTCKECDAEYDACCAECTRTKGGEPCYRACINANALCRKTCTGRRRG